MRELKISVPKGMAESVARLAVQCGAQSASVHEVFVYGPDEVREEIKIKTSTPTAKKIVDAVTCADYFNREKFTISSHELRALISKDHIRQLTEPMTMPLVDVYEDLWQHCHLTRNLVAKLLGGGVMLAMALLENNTILMIGAMLFTPFSAILMSVSFGLRVRDWSLVRQSSMLFFLGSALTILASAATAALKGGSVDYHEFGSIPGNFAISIISGIIAAFSDADDVGRRQLLALAATFPYVKYLGWMGLALVLGFPSEHETLMRFISFGVNIVTITVTTWVTYHFLDINLNRAKHLV